jgi:hypothetical protein
MLPYNSQMGTLVSKSSLRCHLSSYSMPNRAK